jgi:hypothetical protein
MALPDLLDNLPWVTDFFAGRAFSQAAKRNYGMETVDLFAGSTDFVRYCL